MPESVHWQDQPNKHYPKLNDKMIINIEDDEEGEKEEEMILMSINT